MTIVFSIYGLFILFVFNYLILKLCLRLNIKTRRQNGIFRFSNIMILILLITSYVDVLNAAN
ncbi:hypothetical protein P5G51_013375 [Virgibacillus sp. 179-BFC.A HS]|uniref:Uncharacterized protein n=1 Tax=Tigheibacillus jepli TaxID=3035914 RepID=A0ABU5CIU2_9BACI|nr:hypothetical protein [Virgibacillus sp. 179-BFC.A HS]MDY0406248.1 hypothetical protein [Virgibacillus sp. 179-BFC.A HS]